MEIDLNQLFYEYQRKFKINIVAGEKGLSRLVKWVHIVESENVDGYIRGGELVITTGVSLSYKEESSVINFVKSLYSNNACGIIINIGRYIKDISSEIIDFCNNNEFPLFTIPWHIQLVELTREIANKIVNNEKYQISISETFKNCIYSLDDIEKHKLQLERYGFEADANYCVVIIKIKSFDKEENDFNIGVLKYNIKQIINKSSKKYNIFVQNNSLILVLSNMKYENILLNINYIEKLILKKHDFILKIGIGNVLKEISSLSISYKQASLALKMASKNKSYHMFYKDIGIYKLIISVENVEILKEIYYETLGKLLEFDKSNDSDYINFVTEYINHNANVQKIAISMFVHRNTINYKIRKVKEITGYDLTDEEDKFKIILALKIKDILF
jgi:sugar diacid utilization regulator